jgi:hypothetical protein
MLPRPDSEPPDYILVVPSYNRPKALTQKTMKLLIRQRIPLERVFVFVANGVADGQSCHECIRYSEELAPLCFPKSNIIVGVRGIMEQRNFIVRWVIDRYGPLKHVVSLDDDLEELFYKERTHFDVREGKRKEFGVLKEIEAGGLEAWIAHAMEAMLKTNSFIWSCNTSSNSLFMLSDFISTSNGMCNGYCYGFRARPDQDLECCFEIATEDRERSVRYFNKDGIVLRYRMYTAKTKCFKNEGGIQDDYQGSMSSRNDARKIDERLGHQKIEDAFGDLYSADPEKRKTKISTMEGSFTRTKARTEMFAYGLSCSLEPIIRGGSRRVKARMAPRGKFQRKFISSRRRKITNKGGKSYNLLMLRSTDRIRYHHKNLKRIGSAAHKLYEEYKMARSISEAIDLGARRMDINFDCIASLLQITDLDTTPVSGECQVRDITVISEVTPAVAGSKTAMVKVRTKEIVNSSCCLQVTRELLAQLARRSGKALQRCPPGRWQLPDGPLARVSLDTTRILLHWAKTGELSYSLQAAPAVYDALIACGANSLAERARCLEVATGQASLLKFWTAVRKPDALDAEPTNAKRARKKSQALVAEVDTEGSNSEKVQKTEQAQPNLSMFFRAKGSSEVCKTERHEAVASNSILASADDLHLQKASPEKQKADGKGFLSQGHAAKGGQDSQGETPLLLPEDAPPGHLAHRVVRYWSQDRCILKVDVDDNGTPRSDASFTVNCKKVGSTEAAGVIARACFVKFHDKRWDKSKVTRFYKRCLTRLRNGPAVPLSDSDEELLPSKQMQAKLDHESRSEIELPGTGQYTAREIADDTGKAEHIVDQHRNDLEAKPVSATSIKESKVAICSAVPLVCSETGSTTQNAVAIPKKRGRPSTKLVSATSINESESATCSAVPVDPPTRQEEVKGNDEQSGKENEKVIEVREEKRSKRKLK